MNFRSRLLGVVATIGAAALALTACGSSGTAAPASTTGAASSAASGASSAAPEPVEIVFASYSLAGTGPVAEGTQKLMDEFMAANPHITVTGRGIPNAEILTKTRTDVASGDSPDVVQMGYSKVMEALTTLPVQSIEEIADDQWDAAVDGLSEGPLNTGIYNGSNHAVPYTLSTPTLFYNATLFAEVGLDPEKPPTTLDEVRAAAKTLVDAGHQGVYFGVVSEDKSDFMMQSVLNSTGGSFVDSDGKVNIASPESIKGFELMQDLTNDGLSPAVNLQEAMPAFVSGDMGMLITTTAYSSTFVKAAKDSGWELRSAGFPQLVSGVDASPTHSGAALMVLSADPAKQAATWEFIKFMVSHEAYLVIVQEMGYLPLRADMVDDPKWLGDYFAENKLLLPATEQLQTVAAYQFFPGTTSNQSTRMFIDEAVEPVVLRNADAVSTVTAVAEKLQAAA